MVQPVGGALGTASFAVVLGDLLAGIHSPDQVIDAFATVFWLPVAAVVLALPLIALLPTANTDSEAAGHTDERGEPRKKTPTEGAPPWKRSLKTSWTL